MPPAGTIVATHYNDAKNFRLCVFTRDDGSFGYYFEWLMDLSNEPISDPPEIWVDDNLQQHSGAYDSIETAMKEAELDSVWFQNKDRR